MKGASASRCSRSPRSPRSRVAATAYAAYTTADAHGLVRAGRRTRIVAPRHAGNDDATAGAAIIIPTGTTLTTTAAPGTKVGTVKAQVQRARTRWRAAAARRRHHRRAARRSPGRVPDRLHRRTARRRRRTCSCCRPRARRSTCPRTSSRPTAARRPRPGHSSSFCLAPPDIPVDKGGATFGAKFLSRRHDVHRRLQPARARPRGSRFWTPWTPLTGVGQPGRHRRLAGVHRAAAPSRSRAKRVRARSRSPAGLSRRATAAAAPRAASGARPARQRCEPLKSVTRRATASSR